MFDPGAGRFAALGTVLQWGPVGGDNPQFPGTGTFLGLAIATLGGVATVLGVLWMQRTRSDDAGYSSRAGPDEKRLSPVALTVAGALLLVAGLFLLVATR